MWLWEHDFGYSSKKLPQYNCVFLALTGSTEIYGSKVAKSFGRTWDELGRYELYNATGEKQTDAFCISCMLETDLFLG